jgi:hypothetical protein
LASPGAVGLAAGARPRRSQPGRRPDKLRCCPVVISGRSHPSRVPLGRQRDSQALVGIVAGHGPECARHIGYEHNRHRPEPRRTIATPAPHTPHERVPFDAAHSTAGHGVRCARGLRHSESQMSRASASDTDSPRSLRNSADTLCENGVVTTLLVKRGDESVLSGSTSVGVVSGWGSSAETLIVCSTTVSAMFVGRSFCEESVLATHRRGPGGHAALQPPVP